MLGCIHSQPHQTGEILRVLGWRGSSICQQFLSISQELFPPHKETLASFLGQLALQKSMPCKDTTSWQSEPQGEGGRLTCVILIHRVGTKHLTSPIDRGLII